jgi:hypothetical protein
VLPLLAYESKYFTTTSTDIKKFGAFDKRDGYYVEVQGGGQTAITERRFNCYCVRRTSALESNEPGIRTANVVAMATGALQARI